MRTTETILKSIKTKYPTLLDTDFYELFPLIVKLYNSSNVKERLNIVSKIRLTNIYKNSSEIYLDIVREILIEG